MTPSPIRTWVAEIDELIYFVIDKISMTLSRLEISPGKSSSIPGSDIEAVADGVEEPFKEAMMIL